MELIEDASTSWTSCVINILFPYTWCWFLIKARTIIIVAALPPSLFGDEKGCNFEVRKENSKDKLFLYTSDVVKYRSTWPNGFVFCSRLWTEKSPRATLQYRFVLSASFFLMMMLCCVRCARTRDVDSRFSTLLLLFSFFFPSRIFL